MVTEGIKRMEISSGKAARNFHPQEKDLDDIARAHVLLDVGRGDGKVAGGGFEGGESGGEGFVAFL